MKKIYMTITVLFLGFTMLIAQTTTIYPTNDMTTNTGNSGMFPNNEEIWIANWSSMQNYHQTLIKFDLTPYIGQNITSAKLNLYQFFHAPDGSPTPSKVYAITEDWNETDWATSTNISNDATVYASPNFTSELGWYEIDITDLVNKWLNENITNNGLVIIANTGTKFAKFYSKDASDESKRPFLAIKEAASINNLEACVNNFSVFPNPTFNKNANIEFYLSSSQKVNISIFNTLGVKVKDVCNKDFEIGRHVENFSCENIKTGIYWVRLEANGEIVTKKLFIKE